nr:XRE family transcriptional regulator [Acidiferrobacter sp.]
MIEITRAVRRLNLTQDEAGRRMGISQPKVSALLRGDFTGLSERKLMECLNRLGWTCPECGAIHDRDVNAARNLLALGLAALSRPTASSAGCEACGPAMRPAMGEGSGLRRKAKTKPASVKQEVSFVPV